MDCEHVRKRIQGTEAGGSINVRNEDSFVMHTWVEGYVVCFEPEANAIAKLTQCQAIAHQVGGPNVVHGLGSRAENERPVAGSDLCHEVKIKTVISCEFYLLRGRRILNDDFAR